MNRTCLFVLSLLLAVSMYGQRVEPTAIRGADASDMLIPIAGEAAGARGETFVTDLTLVNFMATAQNVELTWLPVGGTAAPQKETIVLQGFDVRNLGNVANSVFQRSGIGAILIRGEGPMDAHARIYTETTCGNLTGTVNQSVPAVLLDGWRN